MGPFDRVATKEYHPCNRASRYSQPLGFPPRSALRTVFVGFAPAFQMPSWQSVLDTYPTRIFNLQGLTPSLRLARPHVIPHVYFVESTSLPSNTPPCPLWPIYLHLPDDPMHLRCARARLADKMLPVRSLEPRSCVTF